MGVLDFGCIWYTKGIWGIKGGIVFFVVMGVGLNGSEGVGFIGFGGCFWVVM